MSLTCDYILSTWAWLENTKVIKSQISLQVTEPCSRWNHEIGVLLLGMAGLVPKTFSFLEQEVEAFPGFRLQTNELWAEYGPHVFSLSHTMLRKILNQLPPFQKRQICIKIEFCVFRGLSGSLGATFWDGDFWPELSKGWQERENCLPFIQAHLLLLHYTAWCMYVLY